MPQAAVLEPQPVVTSDISPQGYFERTPEKTAGESVFPLSPLSVPHSPSKLASSGKTLKELSELAANARRERKVLDLEISNSSLLAINKALEREMRKQHLELRKYKRLTRSGRLSLAPLGRSRAASGMTNGTLPSTRGALSDSSDSSDLSCSSDEDPSALTLSASSDSDSDSEPSTSRSPNATAASDARHLFKDTRRLKLDLARHRRQLVASQQMNQSLKRCLGWTEELLAEGKRALEYKVRVSDVRFGGRVLVPGEEEEEEDEQEQEGQEGGLEGERGERDVMGEEVVEVGEKAPS